MASWVLIPCLKKLFDDFDECFPNRKTDSDGSVGDDAHADSTSDHNPDETGSVPIHDADSKNEVHAIDVDKDLCDDDVSMAEVVEFLVNRCDSGAEDRLRYIIFNRKIYEASNGWNARNYTGSNPHDQHAHFSASYDSDDEADTSSWHLEDIAMPSAEQIWQWDPNDADEGVKNPYSDKKTNPTVRPTTALGDTLSYALTIKNTLLPEIKEMIADLQHQIDDLKQSL